MFFNNIVPFPVFLQILMLGSFTCLSALEKMSDKLQSHYLPPILIFDSHSDQTPVPFPVPLWIPVFVSFTCLDAFKKSEIYFNFDIIVCRQFWFLTRTYGRRDELTRTLHCDWLERLGNVLLLSIRQPLPIWRLMTGMTMLSLCFRPSGSLWGIVQRRERKELTHHRRR